MLSGPSVKNVGTTLSDGIRSQVFCYTEPSGENLRKLWRQDAANVTKRKTLRNHRSGVRDKRRSS